MKDKKKKRTESVSTVRECFANVCVVFFVFIHNFQNEREQKYVYQHHQQQQQTV